MEELSDFIKEYYEYKTRIAPFMLKTDAETVKTAAAVNILLERAYNVYSGASTYGRFGAVAGHNVDGSAAVPGKRPVLRGSIRVQGQMVHIKLPARTGMRTVS